MDNMTPKQIGEALLRITEALVDKTGEQPFCGLYVNIVDTGECSLSLKMAYNNGDYIITTVRADTFQDLFIKARAYIADMQEPQDAAKIDAIKGLAKAVDKLRDAGIDDDFITPVADQVQVLSGLMITHYNG